MKLWSLIGARRLESGGASSGITSWSGVSHDHCLTTHTSFFDTQATLATTVPIAHGRHHTHRPRRPAAARGRGRPLALSIPSFIVLPYASRVLPCSCFHTHHTHVVSLYGCVVVSLYRCIVVSLYLVVLNVVSLYLVVLLYCSCFHTHHTLTLYRCIVVSLYLVALIVVSLCRCISPSRCIVVSLYNVRPT